MESKEYWIKKREDLLKHADAISGILKFEYGEDSESGSDNSDRNSSSVFPIKGSTIKQIMWLFDNKIIKSVRLKDVADLMEQHKGEKIKIDNAVRTLRTAKKLVMVKYDDKQILSWWGKPEWISGNDFKNEYRSEDVPDFDKSEVVTN